MTTAKYERIEKPAHLWERGNSDFYRVTPVKGARIEGIFQVGMTSHEPTTGYRSSGMPHKTNAPAMWVDLSPIHVDSKHGSASNEREILVINGKEYDARFGARVELIPAGKDDYRDAHYHRITVSGRDYFITSRVDSWDGLSDSARKTVYAVIEAIAAEYITDERWHEQRMSEARYRVQRATEKRDEAQAALDKAQAELDVIASKSV